MDGLDVCDQVAFLCEAFVTVCMSAGESGGRGRMDYMNVSGQASFLFKTFVTICV